MVGRSWATILFREKSEVWLAGEGHSRRDKDMGSDLPGGSKGKALERLKEQNIIKRMRKEREDGGDGRE